MARRGQAVPPWLRKVLVLLLVCASGADDTTPGPAARGGAEGAEGWIGGAGGRRIIGGEAAAGDFPFLVRISRIGGRQLTCTGQLVSRSWVLTAAHCLLNDDHTGYRSVGAVGASQVTVGCWNLTSPSCQTFNVVEFAVHPCYPARPGEDHDDLALLRLDAPVDASLLQGAFMTGLSGGAGELQENGNVTLAGFGVTSISGPPAGELMKLVDVRVASRKECEDANPVSLAAGLLDFDKVFCTDGGPGRDSCFGDSGGPAILRQGNSSSWILGVLSRGSELPSGGDSCAVAGRLGVYTRVGEYTDWISTTITDGQYDCDFCPCNCQGLACRKESTKVVMTTPPTTPAPVLPTTTPAPTPAPTAAADDLVVGFNLSFYVGICAGAAGAITIISCIILACLMRTRSGGPRVTNVKPFQHTQETKSQYNSNLSTASDTSNPTPTSLPGIPQRDTWAQPPDAIAYNPSPVKRTGSAKLQWGSERALVRTESSKGSFKAQRNGDTPMPRYDEQVQQANNLVWGAISGQKPLVGEQEAIVEFSEDGSRETSDGEPSPTPPAHPILRQGSSRRGLASSSGPSTGVMRSASNRLLSRESTSLGLGPTTSALPGLTGQYSSSSSRNHRSEASLNPNGLSRTESTRSNGWTDSTRVESLYPSTAPIVRGVSHEPYSLLDV